ncbi:MAG: hypothetical protein CL610_10315 [Anaerolineaceae bacterium]|nr:hypothetical protein [Anaerolineaceae bacterium]
MAQVEFGLGFSHTLSLDEGLRITQRAEELGFAAVYVADQTFFQDPFVIMAYWAMQTQRIKLVLAVTNPYTRHPAQVARSIGVLSDITKGRVELGIGAGNRRELLLPMGHEQTAAADRSREMAAIVRDLLHGKTVHYRSDYVVADEIKLDWEPAYPDVPIIIGARGGKMLEVAGELADGAIIGALISDGGLDYALGAVERGAQRAGRSLDDVAITSWVTTVLADDYETAAGRITNSVAHIIGGAPISLLKAIGLEDDYINQIKATYAEGGQEAAKQHVTRREIDMLALVGTADDISEKIERLTQRGIHQVSLRVLAADCDTTIAQIERLAREVLPNFK